MNYLSVCSGIEAATVAWHPLGWNPVGFGEIEPFPAAVLNHHYPEVPNFGDMTKYKEWELGTDRLDLLVGGTPCQSFSVAGLRKGLDDPRGNLALVYCGMLDYFRPKWFVWENVPGVLSSNGGRDFGSFLGAVAELGYGFSYRVLDAQYFGVAQRRRRVFVVGHFGNWQRAAAVLFERESLRRDTAPSREAGKEAAKCLTRGVGQRYDPETESLIPSIAFGVGESPDVGHCLRSGASKADKHESTTYIAQPIGFDAYNNAVTGDVSKTIDTGQDYHHVPNLWQGMAVRRLMPVECERLQGFPDNYTNIPYKNKQESPDGPRYKALGNSMAVPVMKWIGERIAKVNEIN